MDAISQTTFWSAFSWMKMFELRLKFHWSLFQRVQLTIFQHCLDNGLAPIRRQAIIWTKWCLFYWRIYASLGVNELNQMHIISSDYRYNNDEHGIVPHICQSYIFNMVVFSRKMPVILTGRQFCLSLWNNFRAFWMNEYPILLTNHTVWIMIQHERYTTVCYNALWAFS